ncbi:PspC domain-containing protein [Thermoactinospora rubra]|uniref:PspC domain-containing protein n=1 Tax=Thermoactinospora rubra TaxID=1088767 RepID=UPI000A0F8742|nr:PspC domain-containing protein [Thermoactinospora rubra]
MHRSSKHKIFGGVCGGIAESLGWSPTLVRILWLVASALPFVGIPLYIVLWIILPLR